MTVILIIFILVYCICFFVNEFIKAYLPIFVKLHISYLIISSELKNTDLDLVIKYGNNRQKLMYAKYCKGADITRIRESITNKNNLEKLDTYYIEEINNLIIEDVLE